MPHGRERFGFEFVLIDDPLCDIQEGPLGIKHRQGSPDCNLRRDHDRTRGFRVAIQSGKPTEHVDSPAHHNAARRS